MILQVQRALEGIWRALGKQFERIWTPFGLQVAPEVHLDRPKGAQRARQGGPKGASGRPVNLLCQYLMEKAGKAS